ncbi:hypothetical protein HWV62_37426 [Athelia sp. TMB]|nr:hypothetical protein HWV62_37426 [Athelia sp. TMB]
MPHAHLHSPTYAPPVIRAASPASSLGTIYPPDTTSPSDDETEISQVAFENKWHEKLRLGREFVREWQGESSGPADEGTWAVKDREKAGWGVEPLIAKDMGARTPAEDQQIHEQIMRSLRYQVHLLEDDELFEQTLLRGSQAALAAQPESSDIDALMRSMMSVSSALLPLATPIHPDHGTTCGSTTASTVTMGPWNRGPATNIEGASHKSTPAMRTGAMKGRGKTRW